MAAPKDIQTREGETIMTWRHIGGGCGLKCDADFPCDDMYESETGERAKFYSTMERHFEMPQTVEALAEIQDLEGVKKPWEENEHNPPWVGEGA